MKIITKTKELVLTLEEAKALYEELQALFPPVNIPYYIPYVQPTDDSTFKPIWVDTTKEQFWPTEIKD